MSDNLNIPIVIANSILILIVAYLLWPCCGPDTPAGCQPDQSLVVTDPVDAVSDGFEFTLNRVIDSPWRKGVNIKTKYTAEGTLEQQSEQYALIQIVRTVDNCRPGIFYYPSTERKKRSLPDGWYVDRLDGSTLPYYGTIDDFNDADTDINTLAFTGIAGIGNSDSSPAWLKDNPRRPQRHPFHNITWQAVTVPDIVDNLKIYEPLSAYAWGWVVENKELTYTYGHLAETIYHIRFREAMEAWEEQKTR